MKNRLIFWIPVSLIILGAVGGLIYYLWYITYYEYNIADHEHTIKFSKSDYSVKVIWKRNGWQCIAEIYQGTIGQHEIDLGKWFISNEWESGVVVLTSGHGPSLTIKVDEDSANLTSIEFCSRADRCCAYFNLKNLRWYGKYEGHPANMLPDMKCYEMSPNSTH